ncbi:MAG: CRISPR-associated helicase Cas3' [Pseudomonadota bacterium]|nr:CRISPR-associated helicase Cas3' [Pseudomonadota bacterium]
MKQTSYYQYWGKAASEDEEGYHLLAYHALDVAAVGSVFLAQNKPIGEKFAQLAAMSPDVFRQWFTFALALHDLGKFAESFQNLRPDILSKLQGKQSKSKYAIKHDTLGWLLWQRCLREKLAQSGLITVAEGSARRRASETPFDCWIKAVVGHHGVPPSSDDSRLEKDFAEHDISAALEFISELITFLLPSGKSFPDADKRQTKHASWWLAGLTVFSDWLGSNVDFFPYDTRIRPLADYWQATQAKASEAIASVGMLKSRPASALNIANLIKENHKITMTPLQQQAANQPITATPHLFILEDVTGAGKTEAAVLLAHKLMQAGQGSGIYFALPTMATANAMYARMSSIYKKMFAATAYPSLVLAHGSRDMAKEFKQSVVSINRNLESHYANDEMAAAAHCNAWLADNKKKALLADVGVGTIDQALMAILPSKHQSLRLLGLLHKILIVDEVHACDAYMHKLLQGLLHAHAVAGGSAILLSATLPQQQRQELIASFARREWHEQQVHSKNYPLLTSLSANNLLETAVATRSEVKRNISAKFISEEQAIYSLLAKTAQQGQCACWIRNTVRDAIAAYQKIKEQYPDIQVELFHARFALGDRLAIERQVVQRFGKDSNAKTRAGHVLIATQVVEQSLDLDFDVLVTDLAPIDLVIQRAGRLRRHTRNTHGNPVVVADQRGEVCLHVFAPQFTEEPQANWYKDFFPHAQRVYEDHGQLWLTAKILQERKAFAVPQDMRNMIEYVYDGNAELPASLERQAITADGNRRAQASIAEVNKLPLEGGYTKSAMELCWDEASTPTRLGEEMITIYLAKWLGNKLQPWVQGEHAWQMSSVAVRAFYGKQAVVPPEVPDVEIKACQEQLPAKGKWGVLLPIVLRDGNWRGALQGEKGTNNFCYSCEFGLVLGE